jgi:polyphosphate kinase 2 (PPK2 family)
MEFSLTNSPAAPARVSSTADAPWIVVEGADPPYRSLTVGKALFGAMRNRLARYAKFPRLSVTLAFEGMDAAGKGSTIRRVIAGLDARHCNVIPVAAPTDEERVQPYLWRFWRNLPRKGRVTIYDRTWYGRAFDKL